MTNLDNVLFDLLVHHNCVVIPEFGGFISKRISSRIDYQKGIVHPPSKHLLFNRFLTTDDGLLITSFAQVNRADYDSVKIELNRFVVELDKRLSNGEEVSFKHIGTLSRSEGGHYSFKQDHSFNLLADAYGLQDLDFVSVEEIKEEEPQLVEVLEVQPKVEEMPKKRNKSRTRTLLKYAAAACILPLALYSFWIPFKSDFFSSGLISLDDFNPFYKKEIGRYEPSPSKALISEFKGEEVFLEKVIDIKVDSDEKEVGLEIDKLILTTYDAHYIVGCFSVKENADKFLLKLTEEGFYPLIVDGGKLFRISVGQAKSKDEFNHMVSSAKTKGYKGWTLKK
jgi:hypothetical protein